MTSLGKIAEKDSLGFNIGIVFETGNWDDHALRNITVSFAIALGNITTYSSLLPKNQAGRAWLAGGQTCNIRDPKTGEGAQQQ